MGSEGLEELEENITGGIEKMPPFLIIFSVDRPSRWKAEKLKGNSGCSSIMDLPLA